MTVEDARWAEVVRAGAAAAEVWGGVTGGHWVEVTPADDPDWDADRLEVEGDALPVVAVVPDLDGFAWVDAAADGWLVTLRDRLADDLEDGGYGEVAARLRWAGFA